MNRYIAKSKTAYRRAIVAMQLRRHF